MSCDDFGQLEDRPGSGRGRLDHGAVACGEGRSDLPGRHQEREVERDDLADYAERLVEVVGDGVFVDFGRATFERAGGAGEVAEVVDGQWDVGGQSLAHRLAVLPRLGHGQHLEVGLDGVGDGVEDGGPLGQRRLAPGVLGRVSGVKGQLHIFRSRTGDLAEGFAVYRTDIFHVLTLDRCHPLAPDEVVITRLDLDHAARLPRGYERLARGWLWRLSVLRSVSQLPPWHGSNAPSGDGPPDHYFGRGGANGVIA